MCTPQAHAQARSIGKARQQMTLEGVNLNNLKGSGRKLALTTNMHFKPLPGIALSKIKDPTAQQQRYG